MNPVKLLEGQIVQNTQFFYLNFDIFITTKTPVKCYELLSICTLWLEENVIYACTLNMIGLDGVIAKSATAEEIKSFITPIQGPGARESENLLNLCLSLYDIVFPGNTVFTIAISDNVKKIMGE